MRKKQEKQIKKKNISAKDSLNLFIFLMLSGVLFFFGSLTSTYAFFSESAISVNQSFVATYWVPVLDQISDKTVQAGSQLEFTISATDPNGDPLIYSASNLPSGATFVGQTFLWTPTFEQVGTYSDVHFEVSDGKYTDFENIAITVTEMPAPKITDVQAINITKNSADVIWKTDQLATSKVEYGETISYGMLSGSSNLVTSHIISISDLMASTAYHYWVSSENTANKETSSGDYEFYTLAE